MIQLLCQGKISLYVFTAISYYVSITVGFFIKADTFNAQ
jgi:hypothetical protein